jgi:hypothetical protein
VFSTKWVILDNMVRVGSSSKLTMDKSRRAFVRDVAAIGAGIAASRAIVAPAAVLDGDAASRRAPIFDEQPPPAVTFTVGVPASIPYGRGHHPDASPLAAGLDVLPPGFTLTLAGDQLMLHWDGRGAPGTFQVRAFLDDAA